MHIDTPEQIMQFLDVMQFHRRSSRIGQRECPEENSTGLIQKQLTIVEMTITTTTTTSPSHTKSTTTQTTKRKNNNRRYLEADYDSDPLELLLIF